MLMHLFSVLCDGLLCFVACVHESFHMFCAAVLSFSPPEYLLFCNFFLGVRGLSGSSACRWYIDEDIPDINLFREKYVL
jgi:hypothetical protein